MNRKKRPPDRRAFRFGVLYTLCLAPLVACQSAGVTQPSPSALWPAAHNLAHTDQSRDMVFTHAGQTLSQQQLPEFLFEKLLSQSGLGTFSALSSPAKAWYTQKRTPDAARSAELSITDVRLTEGGTSIMGKGAAASILPDFAGKQVSLTLTGTFRDGRQDLKLRNFLFTLDPSLIQQTFTGRDPQARILLDDSIVLEPVSVTGTQIQAVLNTERVPDLYLKGLHKLSVENGNKFTDTLVQVGTPTPVANLLPHINSVEVIRAKGKPQHLRLRGSHFMVFPKFSYATIDGAFGFGFRTEVFRDGSAETIVHIPNPDTFDTSSAHTIVYATPYGVASKTF